MKNCLNCSNMIPIGEGDHICTEAEKTLIMVLCEYEPTEDYYKCNGSSWEEQK